MEFVLNGNEQEYTEFISNHPKAHFLQSLEWTKVKEDWDSLYFVIKDGRQVRGAGSILIRNVPLTGKTLMYCPRGPVLDFGDSNCLIFLSQEMKKLARRFNALALKIDPDILENPEVLHALGKSGFRQKNSGLNFEGIQPKFVSRLDISAPIDDILAGFLPKTRYNIRYGLRQGVTVREGTKKDLVVFQKLMEETGLRDNFVVRNLHYFNRMYDSMAASGHMKLYLAEHQGQALAGAICMFFGKKCWYLYGASSNSHRNLMPNYVLQWEAIRRAKEAGCTLYDLRGISGDLDPASPLYGLFRFKKGFNGTFTEFTGEWDLVFDPKWYLMWDLGIPILKKLRSKIMMAGKRLRKLG